MESSNKLERLERLDHRFVEIYEETRAKVVEQQKEAGLIVIETTCCSFTAAITQPRDFEA